MIYAPHIVVGAVIGAKTHNLGLIVILGLLSHLIMDKFPHWEYSYSIEPQIKKYRETKSFKLLIPIFFRVSVDALLGILIVFVAVWQKNLLDFDNLKFILLGIFFSILPDITLAASFILGSEKLMTKYFYIHKRFLHIKINKEKEGKITFLGLFIQIVVVMLALILFFV